MKIAKLESHDVAMSLANLNYLEWSESLDDVSLRQWQDFYDTCIQLRLDTLPKTFSLQDHSELVRAVSIDKIDDIKDLPHLTPWICCLIVAPNKRRKGYAKALMLHIVEELAELGYQEAFLWTFDQEEMYSKLGWETLMNHQFKGRVAVIMKYTVNRSSREN